MRALRWQNAARTDLRNLASYIAEDSTDAAQRVVDEILMKAARLPEHTRLYRPGRVPGTREMVCGNYVVVYAETSQAITILRVLHGRQEWPR